MIFLGCQLEIPQEEGLLIEELPLPDWPLGMSRNTDCVDCQLVTEGLAHHGWYNARQVSLHYVRKGAEHVPES